MMLYEVSPVLYLTFYNLNLIKEEKLTVFYQADKKKTWFRNENQNRNWYWKILNEKNTSVFVYTEQHCAAPAMCQIKHSVD